jgi:hypothetical protein
MQTISRTYTEDNYNGISGARRIVKESAVTLDKDLYVGDYQKKGSLTAQLRQTIHTTTIYPSVKFTDSATDIVGLLSEDDFKVEDGETYENSEDRVTWINVPADWTRQILENKLSKLPEARIYRRLSNHPNLTEEQVAAIESDDLETTKDTFADRQIVRYGENHELAGQIVTDNNGKVQYRSVHFSTQGKEDEDVRTADVADFYASEEVMDEINESSSEFELQSDQVIQ